MVRGSATGSDPDVAIIGAGIGGLTLALELHRAGLSCEVFEAAETLEATGVGINILPHASAELARLGLEDELAAVAVATEEAAFYNRFGQLVYREPLGRFAGYEHPQLSIHRGDLQAVLAKAVEDRVGPIRAAHRCTGVRSDADRAIACFETPRAERLSERRAGVVIGCDGIHSVVRKQVHPGEGPPRYSGYNMWRGVTIWDPILSGASMVRAGWLVGGKLVLYPIRNLAGPGGKQLVNWVAEIATEQRLRRDWNRAGSLEDFAAAFGEWRFDWLDVPRFLAAAETILEYPMVDQDPLDRWSFGRVSLLGDAAHPMVPRGSNGAGQAVLDARCLADCLVVHGVGAGALEAYESERRPATAAVVLANRSVPPDAILGEVYERTGDRPFERLEDVISTEELRAISDRYKDIAGYSKAALAAGGAE